MQQFLQPIYIWYAQNKRKLPWRATNNPYLIWISEVILQQTRVSQGLPYYNSFVHKFPDVKTLASANEDELMKTWEGLGYYSRARNLQEAAKTIVDEFSGVFPCKYPDIRKLKGVGDYTAAAIASIAFGLPYPAVDGNVMRLFTRYFGIQSPINTTKTQNELRTLATELLSKNDPGMHNQALMEFGALVCTPQKPLCIGCPLKSSCFAYLQNHVNLLPVKNNKPSRVTKYMVFILAEANGKIIIEKRTGKGIWKNLFQFPMVEFVEAPGDDDILALNEIAGLIDDGHGQFVSISNEYVHQLTHQTLKCRFVHIRTSKLSLKQDGFKAVHKKDLFKFAFPALLRKYLADIKFI